VIPRDLVGLPGLEPGTSSLSVKRSNRLSYSPAARLRRVNLQDFTRRHGFLRNRGAGRVSVRGESDEQSARDLDREVVDPGDDGADDRHDDQVEDRDDRRERHDRGQVDDVAEREPATRDVAEEAVELLDQARDLHDRVDQEERHERDDRDRDRREERQLQRRPEVDVDQAQANLLATRARR
jgi:hypothetical protein